MSPRFNAGKGVHKWTREETSQLVALVRSQLKYRDPLPYSRRITLLNWQEISIPFRTVEESKSQVDFLIKKIRRTRSLAEILSDVDVDPIDMETKSSPVQFSVLNDIKNEMKDSVSRNNAKETIFKRKSKRLSRKRSLLTPFMLFAKYNSSKDNDFLKGQFEVLTKNEKLFWIRKAVTSLSENEPFESILTQDESFLIKENLNIGHVCCARGKKTNVPNFHTQKRKLEANDDAAGSNRKKIKLLDETPIEIDDLIDENMKERQQMKLISDPQELIGLDGNVEGSYDIEKLRDSSASEIEMTKSLLENSGTEDNTTVNIQDECIALDEVLVFEDITIDVDIDGSFKLNRKEELKIETTSTLSDNLTETTNDLRMVKTEESIKPEEHLKIEGTDYKNIKQELYESRPVIGRIRNFWSGLFSRIGSWVAKD